MDSYTKLRIIGTGSFGTVWLIRSKLNQRNYVLKEIPLSVQEKERTFVLNEVKVLSGLRHKNIIRYKEAFFNNGLLCISMEFAHEGDLSKKIQEQAGQLFSQKQVIDWFIQLCLSLKYLHGRNILHRDIKSQNIFLAKNSVIKLGDFGIACVLQNTLDHAQTIIGTPYYLSPEICQRQPYNHKSDIWALGCVLYEVITLKHPFESQDFATLVLKILHGDYEEVPEIHGPLLRDLVGVLLRVDPTERPSAKQILYIPAMKTHVDKVLGRGRMQRSESVSCPVQNGAVCSSGNIWRRPSVLPGDRVGVSEGDGVAYNDSSREGSDYVEKRNLVKPSSDVQKPRESESESKSVCETRRKRPSSEAFYSDEDGPFGEDAGTTYAVVKQSPQDHCVEKSGSDEPKKISDVDQRTKCRSYSTSQVRESGDRKSAMKAHPVSLKETYDVVSGQRQLRGGTFTVMSGSNPAFSKEPRARDSENISPTLSQSTQVGTKSAAGLVKVFLTANRCPLGDISPKDSISTYMRSLRSHLKRVLGVERFEAVHHYLAVDVHRETGNDIATKLFELLGEDVTCFPHVMQLVQCEKLLL